MRQAVADALLQKPIDFADGFSAQVLAKTIRPQGQRQPRLLHPPLAQIDDELQILIAISELPFMNNQARINLLPAEFAGDNHIEDLIERHDDMLEISPQAHPQRQK